MLEKLKNIMLMGGTMDEFITVAFLAILWFCAFVVAAYICLIVFAGIMTFIDWIKRRRV